MAPCVPYQRDVLITFKAGSNEITFDPGAIAAENIGQYLLLLGTWYRIIAVTADDTAVLNTSIAETGVDIGMVATMNEITITAEGASLTTFEIDYVAKTR